jgi:nucleotide-binding universal stress UspA family protein
MTILVPTDFSPLSRIAVVYAAGLARPLQANLVIAAVVNVNPSTETLLRSKRLEQELLSSVQQEATKLIDEIREKHPEPLDISFETATGFPLDEQVEHLVKRVNADLIVMGSRGASGLRRLLIGSNAVTVMNNSSVPVMIIPEGVTDKKPERIVYATDLFSYRDETQTVVTFARLFNAHVHLLHVLPRHRKDDRDTKAIEADLRKLTGYDKISFEVIHHDDVATGVDQFVTQNGADILAMFTHHLDFYEKLLGRSVTRRLAFHGSVPLLTFNKTTML